MANILIVDDDEKFAYCAKDLLERKGYNVEIQPNLSQGLYAVKNTNYDLVVADKNLGAHRGVTPLLDYMREERPDTKVVLWSAEDMEQARKELCAHAFVEKGSRWGWENLENTVNKLLAA